MRENRNISPRSIILRLPFAPRPLWRHSGPPVLHFWSSGTQLSRNWFEDPPNQLLFCLGFRSWWIAPTHTCRHEKQMQWRKQHVPTQTHRSLPPSAIHRRTCFTARVIDNGPYRSWLSPSAPLTVIFCTFIFFPGILCPRFAEIILIPGFAHIWWLNVIDNCINIWIPTKQCICIFHDVLVCPAAHHQGYNCTLARWGAWLMHLCREQEGFCVRKKLEHACLPNA